MKRTHTTLQLTCLLVGLVIASPPAATADENGDGFNATASRALTGKSLGPDENLQTFSYYNILGSALQPRDSSNTYAYTSNGCIYVTGGPNDRLQFPVLLPRFSELRYIRLYYDDSSASDLVVWLTQYSPGTSATDIGSVASTGTSGFGSILSADLAHTYDSISNYTLNLSWSGVANSTLQICGIRIAYFDPATIGLIFEDGFESGNTSAWSVTLP